MKGRVLLFMWVTESYACEGEIWNGAAWSVVVIGTNCPFVYHTAVVSADVRVCSLRVT